MRTTKIVMLGVVCLASTVLLTSATPAEAWGRLPLFGMARSQFVGFDPTTGIGIAEGTGWSTHLGRVSVRAEVLCAPACESSTVTLTDRRGDTLVMQNEGTTDPETGIVRGTYTIVGGTGRFAGATGSGRAVAIPNEDESVTLRWLGRIHYPRGDDD